MLKLRSVFALAIVLTFWSLAGLLWTGSAAFAQSRLASRFVQLSQPDGGELRARLAQTPDGQTYYLHPRSGYPLLQDAEGVWRYAKLLPDGSGLAPSWRAASRLAPWETPETAGARFQCQTFSGRILLDLAKSRALREIYPKRGGLPVRGQDMGNVAVLEDDGTLLPGGNIDTAAVAQKFYQSHGDDFDFLIVWTDFDTSEDGFFLQGVQNQVQGIGNPLRCDDVAQPGCDDSQNPSQFDFSAEFRPGGSSRLQAFVFMNNIAALPAGPDDTIPSADPFNTMELLGQEAGHRWLAFTDVRIPAGCSGPHCSPTMSMGRDTAHWNFWMHAEDSPVEGNFWIPEDGDFRHRDLQLNFSSLDEYLMGLRPSGEVNPFFVLIPTADCMGAAATRPTARPTAAAASTAAGTPASSATETCWPTPPSISSAST